MKKKNGVRENVAVTNISYGVIVRARVVLKRTVVGDYVSTTFAEVIFRGK